ncbi:hypothetical protein [Cesiribacter sp. SM1]|uniref:hypothetical protein n=1 Tax=Cesiribacter sp. SM1 TaxID=2861196 RepID=UPI001CD3785D|nr:hypothetical protein [Cesiribacter sp. SM1]
MLRLLYKALPLIPALSGLYSFLKLRGIIVYVDQQKQADYEDCIKERKWLPQILSLLSFFIFFYMFIRGLV